MAAAPGPGGAAGRTAASSPAGPTGSVVDELLAAEGGGQGWPGPSLPFFLQYLADAGDAATWLQEQRLALESPSCGQDQAGTEALLLGHLRLERKLRTFRGELQWLDEQARAAAMRASLTVCGRGGEGAREGRGGGGAGGGAAWEGGQVTQNHRPPKPKAPCGLQAAPVSHGYTESGNGRASVAPQPWLIMAFPWDLGGRGRCSTLLSSISSRNVPFALTIKPT